MIEALPAFVTLGIALLATGTIAGLTAGLLGVGGGIIIVPTFFTVLGVLDVPLDVRMHLAVGTSLATIIPTSIASLISHHKKKAVDWLLFWNWIPWIFAGCIAGTVVANLYMDGSGLALVFGLIAAFVAIDLLVRNRTGSLGNESSDRKTTWLYTTSVFPAPLTIGFFSSMMGIGGGTLSVPFLNALRVQMHRAVATSAGFGLVIAIPATIGFVVGGWDAANRTPGSLGYVSAYGVILITLTSVLAAPLGAKLAHALSERALRLLFAVFLLLTAARMLTAGL